MPRFAAKCPDLPKALFQHILSNDREKIANRGKMRQIAATNRSQNVVKMGKFYYRGFSGILGFHEMYTFRQGCTNWNLRVSNEPCTDKSKHGRVELARKRQGFDLDVYGTNRSPVRQCRDSNISCGAEQTLCVCEPVGMVHCAPPEATTVR